MKIETFKIFFVHQKNFMNNANENNSRDKYHVNILIKSILKKNGKLLKLKFIENMKTIWEIQSFKNFIFLHAGHEGRWKFFKPNLKQKYFTVELWNKKNRQIHSFKYR